MLSLRKNALAAMLVGAGTLFAVTSTQAGMWSKSFFDFAPACFLDIGETPKSSRGEGAMDAGPEEHESNLVLDKDHVEGPGHIEIGFDRIGFALGREAMAPNYPIPSIITEWASTKSCAEAR